MAEKKKSVGVKETVGAETESARRQPVWMLYKSGISRNSVLAALYALLIFTPATLYMELMTGERGVLHVAWFTLLLWVELTKLSGGRITKQEAVMITLFAGAAAYPLALVRNAWYRTSAIAETFEISPYIPDWAAPTNSAEILRLRTFFHPDWILPITVALLSTAFGLLLNLGLSLFARDLFIETERLPFPMQHVRAQAIIVLTEGEKRHTQILSVAATIGFLWSFVLYALPILWQAWTGEYRQFIPIPWIDLTRNIEPYFPGALFGIATDVVGIIAGFVVPFPIIIGMFAGSFGLHFIGNWLTVMYNLCPDTDPTLPGVQSWWLPGMGIGLGWQRSTMFFWASISIGVGLAVGLAPIIAHPRRFGRALKGIFIPRRTHARGRITTPIPLHKVTLPLLMIGTVGGIALFWKLVPDFVLMFPLILILMIFSPFLLTLIRGRLLGITGNAPNPIEPLQNLMYTVARGDVPVWFAPNPMNTQAGMLNTFKVCQLTETTASSYIKLRLFLIPVGLLVGYLYMELFWRIAPIPSGRYPGTVIYWPIWATMRSIWIKGLQVGLFRVGWIVYSFIIGTGLYLIFDLVFHLPATYIALGSGIGMMTPTASSYLIGGMLGIFFRRKMGDEFWNEYKRIIASGIAIGSGVAIAISLAVAIIIQSIWTIPV